MLYSCTCTIYSVVRSFDGMAEGRIKIAPFVRHFNGMTEGRIMIALIVRPLFGMCEGPYTGN